MPTTQLSQLIPVLQTAIGPVILISGVGLLLLTLANRFGRAVDRVRQLLREMRGAPEDVRKRLAGEVANLYERARLIQRSIIFSTISLLFICCLVSLIISLIAFIMDIRLSLLALKMEMGDEGHPAA